MSIEAPRRVSPETYSPPLVETEVPSGSIEGLFYTEKAGVISIDYIQFVDALKDRIKDEVTKRFRRRRVEYEGVALADVYTQWPDEAEVNGAIYESFDRTAVHSLQSLYGALRQHDLPQHLVFTAHERPFTPWEGPVQEWLKDSRKPYEATGGMYGMYAPDEYPQLQFRRPDGSSF